LERVWIYADESCLGNQFTDRDNPGGGAGLIEFWRQDHWVRRDFWLSEPATTNNRMALRSASFGLAALRRPCAVVFTSDSQYLVKGMSEWVPGWQARGWKRKSGTIENLGLWQELVQVATRHQVQWRWVRGHAGHPQNEYANHLATRAARDQSSSAGLIDSGFIAWLEQERAEHERYLDFLEHTPPTP
jgi:ribonuclease HI